METSNIKIYADYQRLTVRSGVMRYASDTVNYVRAEFELGNGWEGFDAVQAIWKSRYDTVSILLDEHGVCMVPQEVLARRSRVQVNLVGFTASGGTLTARLTSYPAFVLDVDVKAEIYGNETAEITPTQFERFVSQVAETARLASESASNASESADRAQASASAAATSEISALNSMTAASNSELSASESALSASGSADTASENALDASNSADSAEASAQSASSDATRAETARAFLEGVSAEATTLSPGSQATASYDEGVFSFGIPQGNTGNGIASAVLNSDYTLTLTFTDGTSYTTPSIRGEKGEKGDGSVTVDTAMSDASASPVQNKVIKSYVDNGLSSKANSADIPTKVSDLTNDSGFINGNAGGVFYGTCETAAATTDKVVDCEKFTANDLVPGTIILVHFTATNSGKVSSLTMNVNGTGAKHIKYINNGTLGDLTSAGHLKANTSYVFVYDGTYWGVLFNYYTTYSALAESEMHAGTATTARLITAQRLKQAVQYHAPVTSVNGRTGAVIISVPTETSDLTNNGDGASTFATTNYLAQHGYVTAETLATPTFCATDATSQAVLQQAFGVTAEIVVPSSYTSPLLLLDDLEPRRWFCWMNGTEMEFARMSVSVNTGTSAITLYLRGRTSIATGIMGVDSSWTISQLASDAEGVAY